MNFNDIEKVKDEERTPDKNLTEEGRERVKRDIQKVIFRMGGVLNYSLIANVLGLNRTTVKDLVKEIVNEWRENVEDRIILKAMYFEDLAVQRIENPEIFNDDKRLEIADVAFLLNKVDYFSGLVNDNKLSKEEEKNLTNFIKAWAWVNLNPRTKNELEKIRNQLSERGVKQDDKILTDKEEITQDILGNNGITNENESSGNTTS